MTRICDDIAEEMIFRDEFGVTVYAGKNGRNYLVKGLNGFETEVLFQNGDAKTIGINGLTNEALLAMVKDRLIKLDDFLPCVENNTAINAIEMALLALDARMYRRNLMNSQK